MKEEGKDIYNEAAEKWSVNKGIGSIILPEPLSIIHFVSIVLDKMVSKNPNLRSLIITETMDDRANILYYLSNRSGHKDVHNRLLTDKMCSIITREFVERPSYIVNSYVTKDIIITINVKRFKKIIEKYKDTSFKFKLLVSNAIDNEVNHAIDMYKFASKVYEINYASLLNLSINSPVKEFRLPVFLTESDRDEYDKLSKYILDSITIFGSFEKLEECRVGNPNLGLSAEMCRTLIAESNGWKPIMDMSDIMANSLDKLYNPIALEERVGAVYNIIRERSNLVTDNIVKLEEILKIVKDNIGKKILIISKRGEFANVITDYINSNIDFVGKSVPIKGEIFDTSIKILQYDYCGNYHNNMEPVNTYDINGNRKVYKTGKRKGEVVLLKAQSQRTRNLKLFNEDYTRVLSSNNAIDTDFNGIVDLVIITSPMCYEIKDIKYRIPKLTFSEKPNIVYQLYVADSIEETKLTNRKGGTNHEIIESEENRFTIE